jgi:glycosyltransferase involved in cell wall biosynthesis
MNIQVYRLHDRAVTLRPTPPSAWDPTHSRGVVLAPGGDGRSIQFEPWELLCPAAFEATWNGGPRPEDVEIRLEGTDGDQRAFVQSQLGDGRLTFHTGYQFKTQADKRHKDNYALWVRGPIGAFKDGIVPLERIVDTAFLPSTVSVDWKFTAPQQTVRFAAGEPFATILPYPRVDPETMNVEVIRLEDDETAYEQVFQQVVDGSALRDVFARLGALPDSPDADDVKEMQSVRPAPRPKDEPYPPPYHVIPPPPPLPPGQAEQLFHGDYPARISVILPAANESVLLKRTVDQFVATLPENSQVIVVDNGSTDGCSDFLADGGYEALPNGVSVHLIRTPNPLGVARARNRGLARAQGEIVVFSDAHMDLPERWWQPIADLLRRPEVGVVGPGIGVMGKPQLPPACGQRIAEAKLRVEWLPYQGSDPYPVPTLGGGFMAMRHDTLKRAGAFDTDMPQWGSEDLEICVRYWLLGYEVWVAPAVTVLHYFRTASPYKVEWGAVTHNLLRVALLHFDQQRLARVLGELKSDAKFAQAMAYAVESDVWKKRAEYAERRAPSARRRLVV